MERRKYLGRVNNYYIRSFSSQIVRVNEEDIKGYAALIKIDEVNHPLIVGETCLYDDDYSETNFLPDGEHWQLSVLYDNNGYIIEWYFDITRINSVDEKGNPYCDDLYLDAALMPDGQILILDEDEIKDALDNGLITRKEFDMAYDVLNEIKKNRIIDVAYMKMLCSRLRLLFT